MTKRIHTILLAWLLFSPIATTGKSECFSRQ